VAREITGFEHLQFFPVGLPQGKSLQTYRPHTLEELKTRIREEIAAIPVDMCQKAVENFRNRLHQCIAAGGHYLADVIFKT